MPTKMKINVVPKLASTHPLQGSVPDKIDLSDSHQNPPDLGVDMFEINVPKNITSTSFKGRGYIILIIRECFLYLDEKKETLIVKDNFLILF